MFTGIVEATGIVKHIQKDGSNLHFTIASDLAKEAYIDQSISHNGACLTVVQHDQETYVVTAIQETLEKTNLGAWQEGSLINLERSMTADKRLDGHFVQGHVDTITTCMDYQEEHGSWRYRFALPQKDRTMIVSKGSVCINGVSLTVVDPTDDSFGVAIIPYTYEHTNFRVLQIGDIVNIEYDILGKYVTQYIGLYAKQHSI